MFQHLKRGDDACTANSLFSTIAEAIVEAAELSTGPLPQSPLEMWAGEIGDGGPGAESLPHGLLRCVECVLVGSCAVMPKRGCLPIPLSATVEAVFWRLQVVRLDVRVSVCVCDTCDGVCVFYVDLCALSYVLVRLSSVCCPQLCGCI